MAVTGSFEGDKTVIAFVIFVLTTLGTAIPWILNHKCCAGCFDDDGSGGGSDPGMPLASSVEQRQNRLRERVMNVLSCLAGGVILGAGFTHILPDAVDAWGDYYQSRGDDPDDLYPMAFAVALGTLLFLWTVDTLWGHSAGSGHGHSHGGGHGHSHGGGQKDTAIYGANSHHKRAFSQSNGSASASTKPPGSGGGGGAGDLSTSNSSAGMASDDIALGGVLRRPDSPDPLSGGGSVFDPTDDTDPDTAEQLRAEKRRHAFVLCAAMTFHAVCDGLAIGTEESEDRKFAAILLAVAVHKWLDGMAVGVPVFAAFMQPTPRWGWIVSLCVVTSVMTPIGVWIGMSWGGEPISKALLLSISAGSFIFIPVIEMIPAGLADGKRLPLKMLMVVVGAAAMAVLAAWT